MRAQQANVHYVVIGSWPSLAFSEGGAFWLDQIRSQLRGADADVFAEWSDIIEKKSKEMCNDQDGARIIFRGVIDGDRFTLDVDASDSDAVLCLLRAIQSNLDPMPSIPKRFYAALMEALVIQAEKSGKLDSPWNFDVDGASPSTTSKMRRSKLHHPTNEAEYEPPGQDY